MQASASTTIPPHVAVSTSNPSLAGILSPRNPGDRPSRPTSAVRPPQGAPPSGSAAPAGVRSLTVENRHNIAAIGRVPDRGTVFLISQGLLMTSIKVVGNKHQAERLRAVFFEGGKRERVEVALRPDLFYFAATYPDHLDYCIVACDTAGVHNVVPVRIPLTRKERAEVHEQDPVLIVQHPVPYVTEVASVSASAHNATSFVAGSAVNAASVLGPPSLMDSENTVEAMPTEMKRFEEIVHRRNDVFRLTGFERYGRMITAGCPAFNDRGSLVGLQSQFYEHKEVISRVVSIDTVVEHMFGNGVLGKIQNPPPFEALWDTWIIPGDTNRIVTMLNNFPQRDISRQCAERLFEHVARAGTNEQKGVVHALVNCGGTTAILNALANHLNDATAEFVAAGLRALWVVTIAEPDYCAKVRELQGPRLVLQCLQRFSGARRHEELSQFAVVILYNVTTPPPAATGPFGGAFSDQGQDHLAALLSPEFALPAVQLSFDAARAFPDVEVLQKFSVALWLNFVKREMARLTAGAEAGTLPAAALAVAAPAAVTTTAEGGPATMGRAMVTGSATAMNSYQSTVGTEGAVSALVSAGQSPEKAASGEQLRQSTSDPTLNDAPPLPPPRGHHIPRPPSGGPSDRWGSRSQDKPPSAPTVSTPHPVSATVAPIATDLVLGGAMAHTAEVLRRFASREHVVSFGVALVATVARAPTFISAPAMKQCVEPVIEAALAFPNAPAILRDANFALWGLGNDAAARLMIFRHPQGMEALRLSAPAIEIPPVDV